MEKLAGVDVGQEAPMKKIAFASFIGTAIEFYDFYIYGTAAALVFGAVFFPELSPVSGTLASFVTFGVAFLARPLGGALFGHFGDRIGRKAMLIFSLLVMGLATFFVGLLPVYASIGVAAPILLVVLRFLQGIGLGGEWGGAVLMAAEHAPPGKRAFYSGFAQVGPPVGFLLSSGAFLLFASVLSEEQFAAWGWRVPFLFSIVLVGVGLFVRISVSETPVFKQVMETQTEARVPIVDVVRTYPRTVTLVALAGSLMFTFFFVITVFALSYGVSQLGLTQSTMLYCIMFSMVIMGLGSWSSPRSRTGWAGGTWPSSARGSWGCGPSPCSGSLIRGTQSLSRSPSRWHSSPGPRCTAPWAHSSPNSSARACATPEPL
jgi:MFS family permease